MMPLFPPIIFVTTREYYHALYHPGSVAVAGAVVVGTVVGGAGVAGEGVMGAGLVGTGA